MARCLLRALGPQQPGQGLPTVQTIRFHGQEGQQSTDLGRPKAKSTPPPKTDRPTEPAPQPVPDDLTISVDGIDVDLDDIIIDVDDSALTGDITTELATLPEGIGETSRVSTVRGEIQFPLDDTTSRINTIKGVNFSVDDPTEDNTAPQNIEELSDEEDDDWQEFTPTSVEASQDVLDMLEDVKEKKG